MNEMDPLPHGGRAKQLTAAALMAAGALPFLGAAMLVIGFGGSHGGWVAEEVATLYGAVILSFLGGVRWGAALRTGAPATLVISVLPSLLGFFSLFMDAATGLICLIGGFALQALWDALSGADLPAWFIRLRLAVSVIVIACLSVTLYGVY
jgi:hypothetical protein